ncbi:MAG: hypothetical protein ABFD92_14890 [Planctomycetaceae bacterium]|nr:hypothetical protein [Planctomycetaceae bacterium]
MAIIAGIDEAGLGPVLGPLVVSATAFEVPDDLLDKSLWQTLALAVSRKVSRTRKRIVVSDSKKLYHRQRPGALDHLELGALAFLGSLDQRPQSLRGLLAFVCPAMLKVMDEYPWYAGQDLPLPTCLTPTAVDLPAAALRTAMQRAGVKCLCMRSEVLEAGQYNRLVRATRSKATTVGDLVARLLAHVWELSAGKRVQIDVDRQGGRRSYLEGLQRIFPEAQFKVIDESETFSAYRITEASPIKGQTGATHNSVVRVHDGRDSGSTGGTPVPQSKSMGETPMPHNGAPMSGRVAEIRYQVEAEDQHLCVALASMLCKYIRECMMELFNRFWTARIAGLEPTAGYYVDGNRFYQQIVPEIKAMGIDTDLVYRCV